MTRKAKAQPASADNPTDEPSPRIPAAILDALRLFLPEITTDDILDYKKYESHTNVILTDGRKYVLTIVNFSDAGAPSTMAVFSGALHHKISGNKTEIVIMSVGEANGYVFSADVLARSAELFNGKNVYLGHAGYNERGPNGERKPHDVAGVLSGVSFDDGDLSAVIRWGGAAAEPAKQLAQFYLDCVEAGEPAPDVGVSASVGLAAHIDDYTGKIIVDAITNVESVDVVATPAFGSAVFKQFLSKQEDGVKAYFSRLEQADKGTAAGGSSASNAPAAVVAAGATNQADELARLMSEQLVNLSIDNSGLSDASKTDLRVMFGGKTFDKTAMQEAIERKRSYEALMNESAVVQNFGATSDAGRRTDVQMGRDGLERLELAVDAMFGNALPAGASFERIRGARDLYHQLTGDYEMRGVVNPERVHFANITTATLPNIVKNAMNKRVVQFFNEEVELWWRGIIHEDDFDTLNDVSWITAQGIAPLPTVAEGAAYTDLAMGDSGQTSTWLKKGGILPITLETFDRDNTGALKAIPLNVARAAYRALSNAIADIFKSNAGVGPNLADGNPLFHAPSGNLITLALSAANWDTVIQTMYKQPIPGTSERLGERPKFLLVPIELEKTALQVLGSEVEPAASTFYKNVRYGSANVRVCPQFTDANDWVALADPKVVQSVAVGYRFGSVPEIITDGNSSRLFENDVLGLKARYFFTVGAFGRNGVIKANVV